MRAPLVWAFVALGLGLRLFHYVRGRVVWHDEAALIVNVLDKGFVELLGPLRFSEAAPPLFLWLTKFASLALGDGPLALRLLPFLASCASLLLLVPVARHLLPERAIPWAMLLFACSEQLLWHTCEAKPYALDVFAAVLLLALYCRVRPETIGHWCLVFAALAPLLIWLSYPACFLLGGLILALLPGVWERRSVKGGLCLALLGLATGVAFLVMLLGPIRAQHDPIIHQDWRNCFPDWERPWTVPGWAFINTFEVCRYCCKPLGQPLALLVAVGAVGLWREGRRAWVVLLLGPLALMLLAACLHRYPYGGARVIVSAAPAVVLLIAAGMIPTFAWLRARSRVACAALLVLLLLPAWQALLDVVHVWPSADSAGAAAYVLSERQGDDPVTGNDWTHLYYFRQLGPGLFWFDQPHPEPRERLWVVFTDNNSEHEQRLAAAQRMAPPGWRCTNERELLFTSVALFERPNRQRAHCGDGAQPR